MKTPTRTTLLVASLSVILSAIIALVIEKKPLAAVSVPALAISLAAILAFILFEILKSPRGRENAVVLCGYFAAALSSLTLFLFRLSIIHGLILLVAYFSLAFLLLSFFEDIWFDIFDLNFPIYHLLRVKIKNKYYLAGLTLGFITSIVFYIKFSPPIVYLSYFSMVLFSLTLVLSPVSYIFSTFIYALLINVVAILTNELPTGVISFQESLVAIGIVALAEVFLVLFKEGIDPEIIRPKISYSSLLVFLLFIFIFTIFLRNIIEINITFFYILFFMILASIGVTRAHGEGTLLFLTPPLERGMESLMLLTLVLLFPLPSILFEGLRPKALEKKRPRAKYLAFIAGISAIFASGIKVIETGAYPLMSAIQVKLEISGLRTAYIFLVLLSVEVLRTLIPIIPLTPYAVVYGIYVSSNLVLLVFTALAALVKYFLLKTSMRLYSHIIKPAVAGAVHGLSIAIFLSLLF